MLFTASLLLSLTTAYAGPPAHPAERAHDRQEVRQDQNEVMSDRVDAARLHACIADWHTARTSKNDAAERAADACLEGWLRSELAEGHRDVQDARAEVHQSRVEAAGPGRDDQRDVRDDQRDLERERLDQARTRAIAAELRDLHPKFMNNTATPGDYQHKADLLRELDALTQREVDLGVRELHEDNRELREDRRR